MQGGWPSEAKKYLKPASYKKAEQQINSSAPNLGSDKLVYDGKYNQILWSIKKLNIPEEVAFLDKQPLDEGLRDWIAALAATGAIAMGSPAMAKTAPVQQTQSVEQVSQVLAKPAAQVLKKTAIANGITGTELAQFMAQCAHETANFTTMKEHGGRLDFKK